MILKNKKFDIVSIGGATRDVFFKTGEGKIISDKNLKLLAFPYGGKIIPEEVIFSYGGGALNTAVSFSRLGLKTAACINIGKEGTGSLINKMLEKEGINTSYITRDGKAHTALSIIITDDNDHTMFLYRDANDNLEIKNWGNLSKSKWIHVASLSGKSENILNNIHKFIKKEKMGLSWNPGSKQIEKGAVKYKELLKTVSILIMNKDEAQEFLKTKENSEKSLIKKLISYGPKLTVITSGNKGSFAGDSDKVYFSPIIKVKAKETTGAGDAYGSTFVASQILGLSVEESMKRASKNAASVVTKIGSLEGLLTKDKLK